MTSPEEIKTQKQQEFLNDCIEKTVTAKESGLHHLQGMSVDTTEYSKELDKFEQLFRSGLPTRTDLSEWDSLLYLLAHEFANSFCNHNNKWDKNWVSNDEKEIRRNENYAKQLSKAIDHRQSHGAPGFDNVSSRVRGT
jgi:hypothetical protein